MNARAAVCRLTLAVVLAATAAGCSGSPSGSGRSGTTAGTAGSTSASTSPSSATPASPPASSPATTPSPDDPLAGLTRAQIVGQVLMTATEPAEAAPSALAAIRDQHVGNVMLRGRTTSGVAATAATVRTLRAEVDDRSTGGLPLLVSTDQEGGLVQVLRGRGFSELPRALEQGGWSPATLRKRAAGWARQLRAAGVDLNLAPVLDVVPSRAAAASNAPIGAFDRQYGFSVADVRSHGLAFGAGMRDGGVIPTYKHFPGLGRVTGNTDTTSGVRDTRTGADDPYLAPFVAAIDGDAEVIMMSTAIYDRIDPDQPAAFSRPVVTGLLRGRLGFDGVVISDDLSSAAQVSDRSPGRRAVDFLAAGGDLVLAIDPAQMPEMARAISDRMSADDAFRARVEEAAARVVALKRAHTAR